MRSATSTTWFLAGSAVIAVALMTLPPTHNTTMLQLRHGTPLKFVLRDKTVEQVLREHLNDAGLALAALGANAPLEKYEELTRRYPSDPVIPTVACISAIQRISYIKDESSPTDPFYGFHPQRCLSTSVPLVKRAITFAQYELRLEPDNALLECSLADFLIAKGNDREAMKAVHRAATKTAWKSHASDYARSLIRLRSMQRGGLDPREREELAVASFGYQHFGRLRQMARELIWFSEQERPHNPQRAIELRLDTLKIGALMRNEGPTVIEGLVAIAISSIGTTKVISEEELNRATRGLRGQVYSNVRMQANQQAMIDFARRNGRHDIPAFIASETRALQAYKAMASGFINSPLNNEKHWKFGAVWLATTSLLATASWLVALLLIAGGVWLLHRMQPHEDVRWRFSDWALLVLASLGMLVMATLLTWGREWYEAYQKDISGFDAADFAASWAMETSRSVSLVSAALPLGIVFGVLICVARLAGQHHLPKPCMKMISRWVAQRASFFLFVTMLMYAVLLIPLPRLAKPIDESTERLLGGEVSAMKAWAALQKVPSGSANR